MPNSNQNLDMMKSCIGGFHRYSFAMPFHTDTVSKSLCDMIGYSSDELEKSNFDAYSTAVHPADRRRYAEFLKNAAVHPGQHTLQYRLMHKNGSFVYVQDTLTSRMEDGVMYGYSALADVTAIKQENESLQRINETVPCGILRYTCSDSPRVTYVNDQMLNILGYSSAIPGASALLEQYRQNIYLMIPIDQRERFSRFLNLVYTKEQATAGELTALRFDGTRVRLYGWTSKSVNENGEEEFQSVCMDSTERYDRKRRDEEQRYLRALSQVYDEIFEFDIGKKSVRFLHGNAGGAFGAMAGMPMVLDDAMRMWIENTVISEDRARLYAMLETLVTLDESSDARPIQIEFRTMISGGGTGSYIGVLLRSGPGCQLFCCRNITPQQEAARLQLENNALRSMNEQMQELVMQFTDGMLAFEIMDNRVRPLYYSENISRFFGYTKDEWMGIMHTMTPIPDFVSKCHISYEDFLELLENSEAEFRHPDAASGAEHRYKAIRTSGSGPDGSYYVMIYDITGRTNDAEKAAKPRVYIRTFGYLDVFVDGTPIAFRNEKAKELFALLVDRRGGFVTSGEALSVLWEDEPATPVTLARYRKVALRLKNTLEEYGIGDIIESVDGKRRIVQQNVDCDLYDYLSGDPQHSQLFKGSYLQNYSWSENTLAELENMR